MIGLKRRGIERNRPVGLLDREALRAAAVENVGIERLVAGAGGVEFAHGAQESVAIDTRELRRQFLKRVRLGLGHAPDAVFAAQQRARLGIEHLPGKHSRQPHDRAAILRICMAVKVGALVNIALALGVDQKTKWIVMLLELVANG